MSTHSHTSSASLSDPDHLLFGDTGARTTPPSSPPALANELSWPKGTFDFAPLLQSLSVAPTTDEPGYDVDHPLHRILKLNLPNFNGAGSLVASEPNTYELLHASVENPEHAEIVSNMRFY
jgi:hypothetical protein